MNTIVIIILVIITILVLIFILKNVLTKEDYSSVIAFILLILAGIATCIASSAHHDEHVENSSQLLSSLSSDQDSSSSSFYSAEDDGVMLFCPGEADINASAMDEVIINIPTEEILLEAPIGNSAQRFTSKGEENTYNVFKRLYPDYEIEINTQPNWLKNPETNSNLEMDGYIRELNIAYEFDGRQHQQFTRYFHKTQKDFHNQIRRDAYKTYALWIRGIDLIRIPHSCTNEIAIENHIRRHYSDVINK